MKLKTPIISDSPEETIRHGQEFAKKLKPGDCVALSGDLGGGKTHFSKGIISELTHLPSDEIHSPTFTLIEEYDVSWGKIYHVDLYRLEDSRELEILPWDDFWSPRAIIVIEWPERSKWLLERCQYQVTLAKQSALQRRIEIILQPES